MKCAVKMNSKVTLKRARKTAGRSRIKLFASANFFTSTDPHDVSNVTDFLHFYCEELKMLPLKCLGVKGGH